MKSQNYQIDMTEGSILPKIVIFTAPLILSNVLQLLFNAADVIVVGRFAGDTSLAAVGSTGSLINLITNLFIGLSVGANVMAANYFGAKNQKSLSKTVHTAMLLSVISGIILTIAGVFLAETLLRLMGSPDEVLELAADYVRIYFLGITSTMIYNFGSSILRAVGDTKRPLYFLLLAGIINVILNLIFVIIFNMGVSGVALATCISQTISAICVVVCLIHEKSAIHLDVKKLALDPVILKGIFKTGLPAGIQGMLFSVSNVVIQSSVNSFGATVIAGNSAAQNIEGFVWISMNAFSQTALCISSQNYGAKNFGRIKSGILKTVICVTLVGIVVGWTAAFFRKQLIGIYTESQEVINSGSPRLIIICMTYFTCGIMDVFVGALRGIGSSLLPMIVSLLGACGLRLLWIATVFRIPEFHTTTCLYYSYPISWIVTEIVLIISFVLIFKKVSKNNVQNV